MSIGPGELPMTECPSCGRRVPAGEFCGACGAHLTSGSRARTHAFAAHPGEHVLHPSPVSTLFPHLPHRHAAPFRIALLLGSVVLLVMGLLGLTAPGIAVACLLVPLLYLIYLYETDVYEDEPELVIALTFVVGALIAIPFTLLTASYVTDTLVANATVGASIGRDLVAGAVIPLAAQALMLVGPLILYTRRRYDEALDGFSFGVASALGFTLVLNLVDQWPQLSQGLISSRPTVDGTLAILGRGLLVPFIAASTTGLIAGAIWLRRGRTRSPGAYGWTTNMAYLVVLAAVIWAGLGFANILVTSVSTLVGIYAGTAVVLLLAVRVALHHMLLAEAVEVAIGGEEVCFHCHYVVPWMAFCPHCGVATRSTPKSGRTHLSRGFR